MSSRSAGTCDASSIPRIPARRSCGAPRSLAAVEARLRADLGDERFVALREGLEGIVEGTLGADGASDGSDGSDGESPDE